MTAAASTGANEQLRLPSELVHLRGGGIAVQSTQRIHSRLNLSAHRSKGSAQLDSTLKSSAGEGATLKPRSRVGQGPRHLRATVVEVAHVKDYYQVGPPPLFRISMSIAYIPSLFYYIYLLHDVRDGAYVRKHLIHHHISRSLHHPGLGRRSLSTLSSLVSPVGSCSDHLISLVWAFIFVAAVKWVFFWGSGRHSRTVILCSLSGCSLLIPAKGSLFLIVCCFLLCCVMLVWCLQQRGDTGQ